MKFLTGKSIYNVVLIVLVVVMVIVIWQPVIPSGLIIKGMPDMIKSGDLSLDKPVVLRFELSGRGGGNYNLLLSREKIEVTEGSINQADLILAMEAADFNKLIFQMAQGKADEYIFQKLIISNTLRFAGNMEVLALLDPANGGKK
ncbi:MAG: hypothetical protein HN379_11105 [Desulfobacteraceae bacterium]|jgi:hypothetical protein|nr:hypothetical protein [Desulfobacteraceae bacterium]MBT4264678.1 hypothetical protein [Deltaproteobacteria bacterium]